MEAEDIKQMLTNSGLLTGLPESVLQVFFSHGEVLRFPAGTIIYRENERATAIYILLSGRVKQIKGEQGLEVITVEAPEYLGGMDVMRKQLRNTTAFALNDVVAVALHERDFAAIAQQSNDNVLASIYNIYQERLALRLQFTTQRQIEEMTKSLQELDKRAKLGKIFGGLMVLMFCYTSALNILTGLTLSANSTSNVTLILLVVVLCCGILFVKYNKEPLSEYGFTLKNWRFSLWDSLCWSLVFAFALMGLKWSAINFIPQFHTIPLFDVWKTKNQDIVQSTLSVICYLLLSPVQEFIARGIFQSSLQQLLVGKWAVVRAILISNLIFAISHQHLGLPYAASAFIPGLFWGWLFYREKSLVGVSVSHILIGYWAVCLLNIQRLFF